VKTHPLIVCDAIIRFLGTEVIRVSFHFRIRSAAGNGAA
jgi:hypothetical protein